MSGAGEVVCFCSISAKPVVDSALRSCLECIAHEKLVFFLIRTYVEWPAYQIQPPESDDLGGWYESNGSRIITEPRFRSPGIYLRPR